MAAPAASSACKVALVTGANKGIGYAIARGIAAGYPGSHLARSSSGSGSSSAQAPDLLLLCTARDAQRGEAAVAALRAELPPGVLTDSAGSDRSHDGAAAPRTQLRFEQLDVTQAESRERIARVVAELGGLDLLVNNAGIMPPGKLTPAVADEVLSTNYFSIRALLGLLLPSTAGSSSSGGGGGGGSASGRALLRPGARIVNVSSSLGHLHNYSADLQARFRAAAGLAGAGAGSGAQPAAVDALMRDFLTCVRAGPAQLQRGGWVTGSGSGDAAASLAYSVSKSGLTALTACLAAQAPPHSSDSSSSGSGAGSGLQWAACCPGWVKTDMTRGGGIRTPAQGAQTPVMLALEDVSEKAHGTNGAFWMDGKLRDW